MTRLDLIFKLGELGLVLKPYDDQNWTISTDRFANIMLSFNPNTTPEDYSGGVSFKRINANLFTGDQIKGACDIVHRFLKTPLADRIDEKEEE